MRTFVLAPLVCALMACNDTSIEEIPLTVGDGDSYAINVQTYVGYRCGSLDCHGDMGRTLRIYAERGLRSQDVLRNQQVSNSEISENLLSFAALDSLGGPVEENLVLLKGLAVSAGGMAHEGGAVWSDTNAAGYRCLAAWLAGRGEDAAAQAACTEATAEVVPDESN